MVAEQITRPSVLVAHSAAGALAPAIVAAAEGRVTGVAFVDALLPHPGRSWLDTAPQTLRTAISAAATNDHVPPWAELLPPTLLERLLPDASMRSAVTSQCLPVPLRWLREPAPLLDDPPGLTHCYIQLSSGYDAEAAAATRRGWRTSRLDGDHLWPLTQPREVAEALRRASTRFA